MGRTARARSLATATFDVKRWFDYVRSSSVNQGISDRINAAFSTYGVGVISQTQKELSVTTIITAAGDSSSSSFDDNFASQTTLEMKLSDELPSVQFTVSAPRTVDPPQPPPPPPSPQAPSPLLTKDDAK